MAVVLSSTDDESSDVEVVYAEVSFQNKQRQELHMLEILRDSQEPIPVNYNAFKAHVSRLNHTFCQEIIDDVWIKIRDLIKLEKEGKLGSSFNQHSLCGRDNCVCNKKLPVVELISSESENECETTNKCTAGINRAQKTSLYETNTLNKCVTGDHSHQCQSTESSNHNGKFVDKHDNESHEVYSKSCTESVATHKEKIKTLKNKTKRTEKNIVDVSESDSHTNVHSEQTTFKSKVNSESNKTVSYSHHKRTSHGNSSECSSMLEEMHTPEDITCPISANNSSVNIVNDMEINTDSEAMYSVKKKKKLNHSVTEEADVEDGIYKKARQERGKERSKKEKQVNNDEEVQSTDIFEHVSSGNFEEASVTDVTQKRRKSRKIENENATRSVYTGKYEMDEKNKTECFSTKSKSDKKEYKKHKKNAKNDKIPNVDIHVNNNSNVYCNKERDNGASQKNKEHNAKVKVKSYRESLSGITKRVCDLIEGNMKTEDDNSSKRNNKTKSKHKHNRSSSHSSTEYSRDDREHSVTIDAHIQIVRSSKSEGKSDNNISSPQNDGTSNRKKPKLSGYKKYNTSSDFSKAEFKKFIEIEKKERRKEKVKIINHEWQVIHDRFVELMAPKLFKETFNGNI